MKPEIIENNALDLAETKPGDQAPEAFALTENAKKILQERLDKEHIWTDKWFASLMIAQWIAAIAIAVIISPLSWAGRESYIHVHVYLALIMGGALCLPVLYLVANRPGDGLTRHTVAVAQMLFSALFIHLTGGRIETHFHVFGSLAFLAFYRDTSVLWTATVVVIGDHLIRGIYLPQSVYGTLTASPWRTIEHGFWVLFENGFLLKSCRKSIASMTLEANQKDELERTHALYKALAEERAQLLAVAELEMADICESSPVGIFKTDEKFEIVYMNRQLENILGLNVDAFSMINDGQKPENEKLENEKLENEKLEKEYPVNETTCSVENTNLSFDFIRQFISSSDLEYFEQSWNEFIRREGSDTELECELMISTQTGEQKFIKLRAIHTKENGNFEHGCIGIIDDITRKIIGRRCSDMQSSVIEALSLVRNEEEAISALLRTLCKDGFFEMANIWRVDKESGRLSHIDSWIGSNKTYRLMRESSKNLFDENVYGKQEVETSDIDSISAISGEKFLNSILESCAPSIIKDIDKADAGYLRTKEAVADSLHMACGIPILKKGSVIGIIELLSKDKLDYGKDLLDSLQAISSFLSYFLAEIESDKEIKSRENMLTSILESTLDAFITIDEQGRIQNWNNAAENLFAISKEEARNIELIDLIHLSDDEDSHTKNILELLDISGPGATLGGRREFSVQSGRDKTIPVEAITITHRSEGSSTAALFLRDLSQQKEKELLASKLALIVDTTEDSIISFSPDGIVTSWNPGAERLLGYKADEIIGHSIQRTIPKNKRDEFQNIVARALLHESIQEHETERVRKDGAIIDVSLTASPMRSNSGNIEGISLIARDITARKELNKRISAFYSTVSHELRTPLTSIRGSLCLIDDEIIDLSSCEAKEMIQIARESSERLVRLINDILDLKKIEAGKLELFLSEFKPSSIAARSIETMSGMAAQKNVQLRAEILCDETIEVDDDRIIQVLTNLLSNAIKYSEPGQEVLVRVESISSSKIKFTVQDSGPGIDQHQQKNLFEAFSQIDSSDSRPKEGTGLGLAISQAIIEEHGGIMGVTSEKGHGSSFWFELSCCVSEKTPEQKSAIDFSPSSASAAPSEKVRSDRKPKSEKSPVVLIVEDDPGLSRLIENRMCTENYRTICAHSLKEAKAALSSILPDLIILDLNLGDGRGLDLLEQINRAGGDSRTSIVVITGSEKEEERLSRPLVFDWLIKPFALEELLESSRLALATRKKSKVLLIENDSSIRAVISAQLEKLGNTVMEASTAKEAIELAGKNAPDLIVLDLGLPENSTFEMITALENLEHANLLVYTARDLSKEEKNKLTIGITKYLNKGKVSPEEFLRTAQKLLSIAEKRKYGS